MKLFISIMLCIPLLLWSGTRIYKAIDYNIQCGGHLKRAADANTVALAEQELQTALRYMYNHNMTSGYTSILYRTPSEDVGFWYQNISGSLQELENLPVTATPLEKSNLLMKLRETLLDQGEKSVHVTQPYGISVFPHNALYSLWGIAGLILCLCVGGIFFDLYGEDYRSWKYKIIN